VDVVDASVTDLYDEMIAAAGERKLWVVGGGNVASQFADAGLPDACGSRLSRLCWAPASRCSPVACHARRCGSPPPCRDPAE
jgi:hypothetical protein